jgi:hypothetical protein
MFIDLKAMKPVNLIKIILFLCLILSTSIFFMYRPIRWPFGFEAIICFASSILFFLLLVAFRRLETKFIDNQQKTNIIFGLSVGLLWTIEISINNFIQPGLSNRDIIDNVFWGIISLILLIKIIGDAYHSGKIISGIKTGLWTGFSSGLVACMTALLLIVFYIKFIIKDPLNVKEWRDMRGVSYSKDMAVYFAYQTYAGAILHLYILGLLFGLIFGILGGFIGKGLRLLKKTS